MVYFVGIKHSMQDGSAQPESDQLVAFVQSAIQQYGITCVGDEWSAEVARRRGSSVIAAAVAPAEYVAFDLLPEQQRAIGVKLYSELVTELGGHQPQPGVFVGFDMTAMNRRRREEGRKREPGWLDTLRPYFDRHQQVLIVCGYAHVSTANPDGTFGFDTLVRQAGYETKILNIFRGT